MIHYKKIIDWNKTVYLACSGGIDSIAVAHFFKDKPVTLYYHNHNMRDQNDEMQLCVEQFASDFNLDLICGSSNVKSTSENDQREGRLEAFDTLKGQVILAHHLDDCIESYLMLCFNGTPSYSPMPIRTNLRKSTILRPFLLTSKSDFEDYIEQKNLWKYVCEDETNQDISYKRNWIRYNARPLIEQQYPGLEKVVRKKVLIDYEQTTFI